MLVLSRKQGERIVVPQCGLELTVVSIDGATVRLGVSAPDDVGVFREELWLKMSEPAENCAAAN